MRVHAFVCLAIVALAGAAPARAGEYSSPVCVSPATVIDYYADATFPGALKCEALCKKVYADCREQVARSKSCLKATVADNLFYAKNEICEEVENPVTRRQCKASYNGTAAAQVVDVNDQADAARSACSDIRETCLASCAGPT